MPGSAWSRRTEHGGGRRRRKLKAPCPILYGREGKSRKIIGNAGCGRSVAEESGAVLVAGGILGREARKVRRISGKGGFQHLSAENAPDCRILPENCATKAPTEAPTEVVRELPWTLLGTLGRKPLLNGHGGRFRGNVAERPERNDRNGRCRGGGACSFSQAKCDCEAGPEPTHGIYGAATGWTAAGRSKVRRRHRHGRQAPGEAGKRRPERRGLITYFQEQKTLHRGEASS